MKVATWNVNGIRARQAELLEWIATRTPDVVCLQEIKASLDQLTFELRDIEGYWGHWHGGKGYSGVALLVSKAFAAAGPAIVHPVFDFEQRICTATLADAGRRRHVRLDLRAQRRQGLPGEDALSRGDRDLGRGAQVAGRALVLCGDLNVARSDMDIHPKERKPNQVGARPDERALFEQILSHDLVDVGRRMEPDNENLFTWWAPWRNLRQRNIGWRIDYVLATSRIARAVTSITVQREFGTSDHGPVVTEFAL